MYLSAPEAAQELPDNGRRLCFELPRVNRLGVLSHGIVVGQHSSEQRFEVRISD